MRPTLGMVSRIVDVMATARTWEGNPVDDAFAALLEALPRDSQRTQLGAGLGEALSLLRLAPDRVRLALDLILAYDLYEASEGVAQLLRVEPSGEIAGRAAMLAAHPGSSESLSDVVNLIGPSATSSAPALARSLEIARDPSFEPRSESERLALLSLWPGRSSIGDQSAPVIGIACDAGTATQKLNLALAVRRSGGRVRRLPVDVTSLPPVPWLGAPAIVVSSPTTNPWWSDQPALREFHTAGSLGSGAIDSLLTRINKALPRDRRLRLGDSTAQRGSSDPFVEIDSFLAGAFRSHEMAFLSGVSGSVIARVSKEHPSLLPRFIRGTNYWSFPTLVGVRAWNYVRTSTRRRLGADVAAKFVDFATQERSVPVAVTATGEILMEEVEGTYIDELGQTTSEVFFVAGAIRQRFALGGSRSAPDLLQPSTHTAVDPEIHGGSPVVERSRIPVEAISQLSKRAVDSGLHGEDVLGFVRGHYPEIGADDLDDARHIARQLAAAS